MTDSLVCMCACVCHGIQVVVAQWSEHRQLRSEALGSIPSGCPSFFLQCFYSDLPPVAYQPFLLPVVVIRIVTKLIMHTL